MKALVKASKAADAPLILEEISETEPGNGEVRVEVKAASVNPADWKMLESKSAALAGKLLPGNSPIRAGLDFAGVVEAVGPRVSRIKVGDHVAGISLAFLGRQGSYAEKLTLPARMVCRLPEGVDLKSASALPVAGYTAWRAVKSIGKLKSAERALILGASGGVGHLAVQIAKHVCGGFVVGVCSEKNAQLVRDLGADEVVDYTKGDPLRQARAFGPYQVVVDCVGTYSGSECRALLQAGGRHVNVSPNDPSAIANLVSSPMKSRTFLGVPTGRQLYPVARAVAEDRIKVVVSHEFSLEDFEAAFAQSKSGRTVGKIVLVPG